MSDAVKRGYRSAVRAAAARDTRRAVVAAAAELFTARGYGATTVDAVAAAAGVSRKTVFTAVGGKLDLLRTAIDWAVAGDDEPVPVAGRAALAQALGLDDAATMLRECVRAAVRSNVRVAALTRVLDEAAGADPAAADLAEAGRGQRLEDARTVVDRLAALGALTDRLDRREAADVLWLAIDPVLVDRLVRRRGWTAGRVEDWLAEGLVGALLHR